MPKIKKCFATLLLGAGILAMTSPALAVDYYYDNLGRLSKVTYDDGTVADYQYDASGNIINVDVEIPIKLPNLTTIPVNGTVTVDLPSHSGVVTYLLSVTKEQTAILLSNNLSIQVSSPNLRLTIPVKGNFKDDAFTLKLKADESNSSQVTLDMVQSNMVVHLARPLTISMKSFQSENQSFTLEQSTDEKSWTSLDTSSSDGWYQGTSLLGSADFRLEQANGGSSSQDGDTSTGETTPPGSNGSTGGHSGSGTGTSNPPGGTSSGLILPGTAGLKDQVVNLNSSEIETNTAPNGQTIRVLTIDPKAIQSALQTGDLDSLTIKVPQDTNGSSQSTHVVVSGDGLQAMVLQNKNIALTIDTYHGIYSFPLNQVNLQDLSTQLGGTSVADISLQFNVDQTSDTQHVLTKNNLKAISDVLNYSVTAMVNHKSKALDSFNGYIVHSIPIVGDYDPSQLTGVRLNEDGSFTPLPTIIENGQAYFLSKTNSRYVVVQHMVHFLDVSSNYWAADAINMLGNKYIIHGKPDGSYAPRSKVTRIEFVELLTNALALTPINTYDGHFSDVNTNAPYISALQAAVDYGLVNGKGDGTFAPNQSVTREEAATILVHAMNLLGYDSSKLDAAKKLSDFKDANKIGSWAKDNVTTVYQAGLFHGTTQHYFNPENNTLRDQTAVVLKHFLQFVGFSN